MENYCDRFNEIMNLADIKNIPMLAEIIDEEANISVMYRVKNGKIDSLSNAVQNKIAFKIGGNIHWLNTGIGKPFVIDDNVRETILGLRKAYPSLHSKTDFDEYDPYRQTQRDITEMNENELIGIITQALWQLSPPALRQAVRVIKMFDQVANPSSPSNDT